MPLTKEQFQELRNQGLSVEQIAGFETGKRPEGIGVPTREEEREREDITTFETTRPLFPTGIEEIERRPAKAITRTIGNIPSSFINFVRGLGGAVLNPIETLKGISDIGEGAIRTGIEKILGKEVFEDGRQEQAFDQFAELLKTRYGGLENLTRTAVNDPFGLGADITALFSGAAKVLGKGGELEARVSSMFPKKTTPITAAQKPGLLQKGAQVLERANLRLTPAQKTNLGRKLDNVTKWLTDQKIIGSPEVRFNKVDAIYSQMEATLQNFLTTNNTAKGIFVSKDTLIRQLEKLKTTLMRDSRDAAAIENQMNGAINNLKSQYRTDRIPISRLNELKKSTYQNAYNRIGEKVLDAIEHSIADLYREAIEKATTGLTIEGKTLAQFNSEYGNAIRARKLLAIAMNRKQIGFSGKVLAAMLGAAATGITGFGPFTPVGAAAGVVGAEILTGTVARSLLEAGLITLNQASQFTSKLIQPITGAISEVATKEPLIPTAISRTKQFLDPLGIREE